MRTHRSRLTALFAGLAALLLFAGCFDIEESVDLDRNLSGKAGFSATVDMGAMVLPMLMMQRQMAGKTGDPTPAEIAAARKEMAAQQKTSQSKAPGSPKREDIEKTLPPGIRLLDVGADEQGDLKLKVHALFGFDDLNKLAQIRDPKKDGAAPEPGKPTLFDRPFSGLKLVDEGRTILVSTELGNPVAEAGSQAPAGGADAKPTPEAERQMKQIFQGLHLRFKLTTPFEVADTNATRRDGRTLVWDYDLAAIQKLTDAKQPVKIWARLRR
jgi:hypothetical protein